MNLRILSTAAATLLALAALVAAQDRPSQERGQPAQEKAPPPAAAPADANLAKIQFQKPCYPLKTCPVSGDELGAGAVDEIVDGRLVRVCCKDCVPEIAAKKAEIFKAIDAGVIAQQKPAYPLEKCPISGEALGADAVDHVHGTRLVRLCCKKCVDAVVKDAEPVLKKLNDAYVASQKPSYPLDTCVISDEKLGSMGEPIDFLYGTRLYRLCCGGCKKAVMKNADALWAKIETARAAKKTGDPSKG
jgi:hypothetical protein